MVLCACECAHRTLHGTTPFPFPTADQCMRRVRDGRPGLQLRVSGRQTLTPSSGRKARRLVAHTSPRPVQLIYQLRTMLAVVTYFPCQWICISKIQKHYIPLVQSVFRTTASSSRTGGKVLYTRDGLASRLIDEGLKTG